MSVIIQKNVRLRKAGRIALKSLLGLFLLIVALILFLHLPFVQKFVRNKAVSFLENKLKTNVEVGSIYIGFPQEIILRDVYIEDLEQDTLLAGGTLRANLNLWRLFFKNELNIESIRLKDITARIIRESVDSAFNYQFIVDAFVPPDTATTTSYTAAALNLGKIRLDNINMLFNDVVTGSDISAKLDHLDVHVDIFDAVRFIYDFKDLDVSGLTASINQLKPLAGPTPVTNTSATPDPPLSVLFNAAKLEKVNVSYSNAVSGLSSTFNIGSLEVTPDDIDMLNQRIDFSGLKLHDSKILATIIKQDAEEALEETAEVIAAAPAKGWVFNIGEIDIKNSDIRFDNFNSAPIIGGIDFNHIHATDFNLNATKLYSANDTIRAVINNGSFNEKSGFVLNELKSDILYSSGGISLENLYLKTPGTELKDKIAVNYFSLEVLKNNIGSMELDIDLDNSKLLIRDLLAFVPDLRNQPAFANAGDTWYINSRITGRVSNLQIEELQLQGLGNTKVDIAGNITGLPDLKNFAANLVIRNISSTRQDILAFIPKNQLPKNFNIPGRFSVNGNIQTESITTRGKLNISTDMGNASVAGTIRNPTEINNAAYTLSLNTSNLNVGALTGNKEINGPVSATITATGQGFDLKTARTKANGTLHLAVVKGYNYRNLKFDAVIANQQATVNAAMHDPNLHFTINGIADLSSEFPSLQISGMIDSIKMNELNLASERTILRGKINGNFPVTDPDNLRGELFITDLLFVRDQQRLNLDTIQLVSGRNDSVQFIRLTGDVVTATLEGEYQLSNLPAILQNAIEPYFSVTPGMAVVINTPYDFILNANVLDNPALKTFVPNLERLDSLVIRSNFSNAGWNAVITAPIVDMGQNLIRNLNINAGTGDGAIAINGSVSEFRSGNMIHLQNTSFTASLANNNIDFNVISKDRSNRDRYNIGGFLQQQNGDFIVSLSQDSLLLNYDLWNVSASNRLVISGNDISANNFILSRAGQELRLNSQSATPGSPLEVNFSNFQLATITGFIQTDSTFATGTINGNLTLTDFTRPTFTADMMITDVTFKNDSVGNIKASVNARNAETYIADITLTGHGNDVSISGNYHPLRSENNFDLDLIIRALPLRTLEALTDGQIRNTSGYLSGNFDLRGNMTRPVVVGELAFHKAGFTMKMLNSTFTVDQETIKVNEQGFTFNRFQIRDSAQNALTLNGTARTGNFMNYEFDLDVRANDFQVLNSTKKDNNIFYGRLFFNTNLKIKGTETAPEIDGSLVVNERTRMTFVLPQREPGVVERDGIIEFVDFNAPLNDSLFLAAYDSLNMSGFTGMDIAVNLTVVPEAEFSLVIDEGNGDFLNVKGEASLTAGIDPSGKINLVGSYDLDQGSYELTFNFLKRKFNIEKGSRIVWEGEPTDATVDVKAVYVANASPLDLVKDQLGEVTAFERNTYLQKLPFNVHLSMAGQLMQPQITFDIVLPGNRNYGVDGNIVTNVQTRLDQLRQEEGEMNKQVFSLLLLNRFMTENPFNSSGGGVSAGALARQSVSKLLTEQLNNLAGELIAGVDINFDVLASEDYTTGERVDRTDLNVGLSKRLLNDRLTVSIGSNFALEGPQSSGQQSNNIAGNVAIDYRLSNDNRYLLRAYRKNEYQGVIDGYIIETGVGFIITLDYNRFREIFLSKDEREKRRQRRQDQRRKEKEASDSTTITNTIPATN